MKYNIQINQLALHKTNLDLSDCAILDYLYIYCNSLNEKIDRQRIKDEEGNWTWLDYKNLIKEMPLLKIKSSGAITPRIKKIEKEGFIRVKRVGHQKLYIRLTKKIDEIFFNKENITAVHENEQLEKKAIHDRERIIYTNRSIDLSRDKSLSRSIDHLPNITQLKVEKEKRNPERQKSVYPVDFEEFWQEYPPRGSKLHAFQEWQKLKPDQQLKEEIITAVRKNKEHETWDDPKYIPHAVMYLKRRRWEDILYQSKRSSKFNKVEVSPDKYSNVGNKFDI